MSVRTTAPLAPIVFVTGKGGVGKSTMAAALALLCADDEGGAVLVELGDGAAGKRALAGFADSVEHVVVRPADALHRGATPLFGSALLSKLALGNFAMRPLLQAAPAIRELAMLECVRQIAAERPAARVVVDMPSSGHVVPWLRVAAQGRAFLGSGPLFALCDRVVRDVLSPGRASVVVVTLPERLVIAETLELCGAISRETALQVDRLIVNRVPMPFAPEALREVAELVAPGLVGEAAAALLLVLRARAELASDAAAAIAAIRGGVDVVASVPQSSAEPSARVVADRLREQGLR